MLKDVERQRKIFVGKVLTALKYVEKQVMKDVERFERHWNILNWNRVKDDKRRWNTNRWNCWNKAKDVEKFNDERRWNSWNSEVKELKDIDRFRQNITGKRWKCWKKLKGVQVKEIKYDETRWNSQT